MNTVNTRDSLHVRGHRGGFLLMDVVVGTAIAIALLISMSVAVSRQFQGERRLAMTRAATRQIEADMLGLQSGQSLPAEERLTRLTDPAPAGRTWVRLDRATTGSGSTALPAVSLVGLVPASVAAGATPERASTGGNQP
jgi:hypothetical protein